MAGGRGKSEAGGGLVAVKSSFLCNYPRSRVGCNYPRFGVVQLPSVRKGGCLMRLVRGVILMQCIN